LVYLIYKNSELVAEDSKLNEPLTTSTNSRSDENEEVKNPNNNVRRSSQDSNREKFVLKSIFIKNKSDYFSIINEIYLLIRLNAITDKVVKLINYF
jgi:hypothetical protein